MEEDTPELIAALAQAQRLGSYTTESDALTALHLVERLARLVAKERGPIA